MAGRSKHKVRDAQRGRLAKQRADALEDRLARVMRAAFASGEIAYIGGLEGPLRHGIRGSLCLGGWKWQDADRAAQATLEGALRRVRAVRPSWYEGQPEHTIQAGTLIERTRCVVCSKTLTDDQKKFCSHGCATKHGMRLHSLREATEENVTWIAIRQI